MPELTWAGKHALTALAKGGTKEGKGNISSKNVCLGNKCRSEKLTFVILFCVYKWSSSWDSKPMIEKESGCVMHENAFVNTCQVSFLWLLKQLEAFSTLEICLKKSRQDKCLSSVMYVHTIPKFKVLNEITASGSLHLQVLATLIDGDKPELKSKGVYVTFRETENLKGGLLERSHHAPLTGGPSSVISVQ